MATEAWAPAYELYGEHRRVVAAQFVNEAATGWARQAYVPVQRTAAMEWMAKDAGFVWPGSVGVRWPTDDPDC